MQIEVGTIVEGKVTGITKFGAFVALEGGKSGLVHISEIANSYVSDVNEHLKIGQTVKTKVIAVDENGRINLSIKKALPPPESRPAAPRSTAPRRPNQNTRPVTFRPAPAAPVPDNFEDKLKQFMKESDSRMNDLNRAANRRSGRRK